MPTHSRGTLDLPRLCKAPHSRVNSKSDVIADLAARRHPGPSGGLISVSKRTLYRWCTAYEKRGYEGLEPTARLRVEDSRALPRRLLDFLSSEKQDDPAASVPEVIRRARLQGILAEDTPICRTSAWRACRRLDLPVRRMRLNDQDRRRFTYPASAHPCLPGYVEFDIG